MLFISFLRLAFLLFVGVVTFRAFGQQAEGFGRLSRASLCRVAILAQLLWFASELLLGSALVTFYPIVKGEHSGWGRNWFLASPEHRDFLCCCEALPARWWQGNVPSVRPTLLLFPLARLPR